MTSQLSYADERVLKQIEAAEGGVLRLDFSPDERRRADRLVRLTLVQKVTWPKVTGEGQVACYEAIR